MLKSILVLILLSLCIGTAAWLFFVWAVKKGSFDDVEGPKYRMLEDDDQAGGAPDRNNDKHNDRPNQ